MTFFAVLAASLALLATSAALAFLEGRRARRPRVALSVGLELARLGLGLTGTTLLLWRAPQISWAAALLVPLAVVLVELVPWHLGARFRAPPEPPADDEPLRELLDQGREAGTLHELEHEVIERVLSFPSLTVGRLMTPRREMFSIALDQPWGKLIASLKEAGYSRVPVWEGSRENFVGVLLVKDLLAGQLQASAGLETSPRQLRRLLRPLRYVPTTRRAVDMLAELRAHHVHMALVVDEHGTVIGLITLDDLLTELVGELPDETDDDPDPLVRRVGDTSWLVNASMDAEDFADRFELTLPTGDFHTVGGLVIHQMGDLAHVGDRVSFPPAELSVRRVEGRRIIELLLEIAPDPATTGEEA